MKTRKWLLKPVPVPNKKRAFTLIELAIVLVIIGMAAAIAFPKLAGGLVKRERLRSQANAAAALTMQARNLAAATGTVQMLIVDQNSGTLQVVPAENRHKEPQNSLGNDLRRKLPYGITIRSVRTENRFPTGNTESKRSRSGTAIRFYPEGTADAARIAFTDDKGTVVIVKIDPLTGRTEVTENAYVD